MKGMKVRLSGVPTIDDHKAIAAMAGDALAIWNNGACNLVALSGEFNRAMQTGCNLEFGSPTACQFAPARLIMAQMASLTNQGDGGYPRLHDDLAWCANVRDQGYALGFLPYRVGEDTELSESQELELRAGARDHFSPGDPILDVWHPIYRAECGRMLDDDAMTFMSAAEKEAG